MLTSKQRAYLKSLAMELDPIILLGKASLTTETKKMSTKHLQSASSLK